MAEEAVGQHRVALGLPTIARAGLELQQDMGKPHDPTQDIPANVTQTLPSPGKTPAPPLG